MAKFTFHLGFRPRLSREHPEREAAHFGRDAQRDWRAVFIAFLLLNLASVAFSFYLYRQINQGELFLADKKEPVSAEVFNREKFEKAVAHVEEKREKFEALKAAPLSGIPGPGPVRTPKEARNF